MSGGSKADYIVVRGLKLLPMDQYMGVDGKIIGSMARVRTPMAVAQIRETYMSGNSGATSPMVMAPTPMPTEEGMSGNSKTDYIMVGVL